MSDNFEKTILIVDDEKHVRQSFIDYFEDNLWIVFEADSGEAALEFLKTEKCSGAIVDIRMGGIDGETFIKRANKEYPDMRFVICTGSPEYEASTDLLQKDFVADKVYGKPVIDIGKMEETLIKLIENY